MSRQRTAEDVASMEIELVELRASLDIARNRLIESDTERKSLKIENAMLQRKADDSLAKATRIETILTQVSAGLVAGINEMKEERELARAVRREAQEHVLGVGGADTAGFLHSRQADARTDRDVQTEARTEHVATPAPRRNEVDTSGEADTRRAEQLRGAAEHVAQPPRFLRPTNPPGMIDTSLASRDSRLPKADYEADADRESLLQIAGKMQSRSQ